MNFRPLCTAMVWPINSGTMVERRGQVFTTFFSLRVFRPSIFSRRWPSTNGPFFSERAIDPLLLHSPQPNPLGPRHLLESPHRPGYAVRPWTKRTNKSRARRILLLLHDHRPPRFAQLVEHRNRRRDHYLYRPHRLGERLNYRLHRLAGRAHRQTSYGTLGRALGCHFASAASCRGRSCCTPGASCRSHRFSSQPAALVSPHASRVCYSSSSTRGLARILAKNFGYFRRWTMFLSVRLLCRVFLPSVGKAQGVCGWLPLTLPSPPPCG